ncbi:Hypothetical predicted protein [Mytilus galloprovincialis]|uniref:Peptidase A2 domain-containing protein n=1 Tax=Mytilus galloprovincialis TaxID=29158 RepID=A0A8B6C2J9_MYTGA|nr:Hypothetical predicted protein [Mytilus galloprovincialis]
MTLQAPIQSCLLAIRFGDYSSLALIDTGSSISCINHSMLKNSKFSTLALEKPKITKIEGAGGAKHQVTGQITVEFSINKFSFTQTFYVIPALRQSMILGTDFLAKNRACIDWETNSLFLKDRSININFTEQPPGYARVSVKTVLSPNSVRNVPVKLSRTNKNELVLLEPTEEIYDLNVFPAKCLIQNIPGQVYIQILNVSDKEITLEIDLVVATVSTVEEASVFNLKKDNELDFIPNESVNINNENSNEEYKPPPIDFDLSKSVLTTEQKEIFQKFLAETSRCFCNYFKGARKNKCI